MTSRLLANRILTNLPRVVNKSCLVNGAVKCIQQRNLNLHEYQSKALLEKFGLNVQKGSSAINADDAYNIAKQLKESGTKDLILKCQVLAGGRGKGTLNSGLKGGVQICSTPEQVRDFSKQMLGYRLVTHQTASDGELVKRVLVLDGVNIVKELYLAIVMDRAMGGPVFVVSKVGGVEIEEVSATNPSAIVKVPIDIAAGIQKSDAIKISNSLGFSESEGSSPEMVAYVADQMTKLYSLFLDTDATQVEINPLAITDKSSQKDHLICVDAKIGFDDNAAYRQKTLFEQEDKDTMDYREKAAEAAGLNFVGLTGSVGCLVNGAGLAMSTMDIIKLHGGDPANFLDVGGGADEDQVEKAFTILQSDPNVKALFVNIFGGIMKCDTIATGLIEAAKKVHLKLPLIVRLVGNRVDLGKKLIEDAKMPNVKVLDDFDDAAKAAVKAAAEYKH